MKSGLVLVATLAACRCTPTSPPNDRFVDVHPSLLVTNPRVLLALEADRFSFGAVFGLPHGSDETAIALNRSPLYSDLAQALTHEIDVLRQTTPNAGVGSPYDHRLFDVAWLTSARAHFELVGVVNRLDFRSLVPPGCGQTRLVYRLAFDPEGRPETRLPLTVNVIFENREPSCAEVARRWLALEQSADLIRSLKNGPLAKLDPAHADRIEINLQSLRQNSKGLEMDDHAEYVLRGFNVVDGRLVEDILRNTPDVAMSSDKRDALREWIVSNLDLIEAGSAELPTEFLAKRAVSVAPRGLSRLANRPFKRLFPNEDSVFGGLPYAGKVRATSPAMLVRRLDEMSCTGCHQSRTIAGFQLLGEERVPDTFDRLTTGISEHLRGILGWRYRFLQAAAEGFVSKEPAPFAERPDEAGGYGAHCTTAAEVRAGYPAWPCADGLLCWHNPVDGDPIGQCATPSRLTGDVCKNVSLTTAIGPDGDKITPGAQQRCYSDESMAARPAGTRCEPNERGFPGGMCSADCSREGEPHAEGVCVRIPHHGFEAQCFRPDAIIEQCLAQSPNFDLQLMRTCSRTMPCRDDFVCARVPNVASDHGACVPPYFLFQTRVDGPPIDRAEPRRPATRATPVIWPAPATEDSRQRKDR